MKENCLITGVAGFIGFHLALKLLKQGHSVIGFDNLNDYYHIDLKKSRLKEIEKEYQKRIIIHGVMKKAI